jgi:hypothetical protein
LKDAGFVEGENVAINYRWADDQINREVTAKRLVQPQVGQSRTFDFGK